MNDADFVRLAAATYSPSSVQWDVFWDGSDPDGVCGGIKDNTLVLRGSITAQDWLRDLLAFPSPVKDHPQFGPVHAGFDEGMDEFFAKASKLLGDGANFCGHSLGAARAWLAAGRYILAGGSPSHIAGFGSPKPGCQQFGQFLSGVSKSSYRNGYDPVTEVPFVIGSDMAIAVTTPQDLNIEPTDWHEGLMAWHNINLYVQGVVA